MKKVSALLLMSLLVFYLAACGKESTSEDNTTKNKIKNETAATQTTEDAEIEESETEDTRSTESQAESMEDLEDISDLELTLGKEKTYFWEDESTGTKYLSYYAVIENESDKAQDIRAASVTFNNDDGKVIYVSEYLSVAPSVIGPGEIAYVSASQPAGILDINTKITVELAMNSIPTTSEVQWLDISHEDATMDNGSFGVSGEVTNNTDKKQDYIHAVVGVYNGDKFLGVMEGGVETSLDTGAKSGVEMFYPPFPTEAAKKADSYEMAAYSIKEKP